MVSIDSGPLVSIEYGAARPDIAASFGSLTDGAHGGGAYLLDTTTLENGVHQIGWFVTDSCGRSDGIGSRFFTVLNGTADRQIARPVTAPSIAADRFSERGQGRDPAARVITLDEGERVELPLPTTDRLYTGWQIVNGRRRPLPVGSSLDAARGIFYWQPAPGFLGSFELAFSDAPVAGPTVAAAAVQNGPAVQTAVRFVVGPPLRLSIDAPSPAPAGGAFVVVGWMLDLGAATGSGVDAVHVWAHPATGGTPRFLGSATMGGLRPEVAAVHGPQFAAAGFELTAPPLPAGVYDIAVHGLRPASGMFDMSSAVRVTIR
jgi:hypothetical protein